MTIVHISTSLNGGGAEQMVLQLAKQSHSRYRTIVISINNGNSLEDKFKSNNIEYYFLNVTSFKNKSLAHGIKQFHEIIKNCSDVILHCHQFHGCIFGLLYNFKYNKKPLIFTLHSSTIEEKYRKILLYLTKPFRDIDIIFSKNAKKWFLKNTEIIPNGIDFNSFNLDNIRTFDKSETFKFLYLGRLSEEKNPIALINFSQNLIKNNIQNFKIIVVGEGPMKDTMTNEILDKKLETHIILEGFQLNIGNYLNNSHCLILPSFWEGMPVVLIEAAVVKLPIISTPVGSIPDFLNDNNATLSNLDTFHLEMINVMNNYPEALNKSNVLFEEVKEQFKIENVFKKHLEIYKSFT